MQHSLCNDRVGEAMPTCTFLPREGGYNYCDVSTSKATPLQWIISLFSIYARLYYFLFSRSLLWLWLLWSFGTISHFERIRCLIQILVPYLQRFLIYRSLQIQPRFLWGLSLFLVLFPILNVFHFTSGSGGLNFRLHIVHFFHFAESLCHFFPHAWLFCMSSIFPFIIPTW